MVTSCLCPEPIMVSGLNIPVQMFLSRIRRSPHGEMFMDLSFPSFLPIRNNPSVNMSATQLIDCTWLKQLRLRAYSLLNMATSCLFMLPWERWPIHLHEHHCLQPGRYNVESGHCRWVARPHTIRKCLFGSSKLQLYSLQHTTEDRRALSIFRLNSLTVTPYETLEAFYVASSSTFGRNNDLGNDKATNQRRFVFGWGKVERMSG